MRVTIEVIPHGAQRYLTVGDWQWDGEELKLSISAMGDWRYEMLVAVHELIECMICKRRNISQEQVDSFDMLYEKLRQPGDDSEPGDSIMAPYHREHEFATCIERLLARELGVEWAHYDKTVGNL